MPERLSRNEHALRHGPTAGDHVRLGDTDLWIRIERDLTEPADQVLWGYAKNFRSRMGQHDRATSESELDAVIGGAIVIDPLLGILKADVGIKDGRVVGIGRAGNPDITDGVDLTIGPGTWPIPCHGLIVTPGAIDSHVHLLTPRLVPVALSAGVTTLITAGFEEPAWRMLRTLEAFERMPVNLGLQASARTDVVGFADDVIASGAIGLKVHEDWGASARIIDAALTTAEVFDIAVCMHTDGLNESGELEETVAAIDGRTIHAYHVEGVGGGHIPDLIGIVREPNVICSSTTPGLPYARATAAEHVDMILIVHEGNPALRRRSRGRARADPPGDHGRRRSAARPGRDLDHQQRLAGHGTDRRDGAPHVAARPRDEGVASSGAGSGWPNEPADDNARVLRYLAKYTVEPARVHGIQAEVGSLAPGHVADLVLWSAASFGTKPVAVMKGGVVAWGPIGEGNASVHGAEPTRYGPDWGATGDAAAALSTTFVSGAALEANISATLSHTSPGRGGQRDARHRTAQIWSRTPRYRRSRSRPATVPSRSTDGSWRREPVDRVPLNRRYFLT